MSSPHHTPNHSHQQMPPPGSLSSQINTQQGNHHSVQGLPPYSMGGGSPIGPLSNHHNASPDGNHSPFIPSPGPAMSHALPQQNYGQGLPPYILIGGAPVGPHISHDQGNQQNTVLPHLIFRGASIGPGGLSSTNPDITQAQENYQNHSG